LESLKLLVVRSIGAQEFSNLKSIEKERDHERDERTAMEI